MIVMDTNALSEALKPLPDATAMRTIMQLMEGATLTAVTLAELADGAKRLPRGQKRSRYASHIASLRSTFGKRILDFTVDEVDAYASVRAARFRAGRPIGQSDAMIAAICLTHDAALVTRNVRDFEGVGLELIDPWAFPQ
jgi:predicted nucleic acid-binding protein